MTRGRKPQSIVSGSSPIMTVPAPPTWLSKDAKAEWRRVAPILIDERRTLTVADLATFTSYCVAVGRIAEAARIIAKEGLIMGTRKHPAVAIENDSSTQARLLAAELGLTPVSRSRPAIRDEQVDDDDASDLGL